VLTKAGVFRAGPGHRWTWTWWRGEGEDRKEVASIGTITWGAEGRVTALQFRYTMTRADGEKESLDYRVRVVATPCNYGGERYWFICPLSYEGRACERRVGKLYLPPGGRYFGCRHCYDLTYESAQSHDKRVDALANLPPGVLMDMVKSDDARSRLLVLSAAMKVVEREEKRRPRRRRNRS